MDDKAKAPEQDRGWQNIDIFVFSNGQQYSPPRKYHLKTEDIQWWKGTLNYLARAQYGSLHSTIDLFTIDGAKLEGPMQLQNGSAYVAVEPPDAFIEAGYEKYLIRASRSWDKRQAKKSLSIDGTGTEKRDGSTTLNTIISSIINQEDSEIVKSKTHPDKETPLKTPLETFNEKHLNSKNTKEEKSFQPPTVLKKTTTGTPQSSLKPSNKRKEIPKPIIGKSTKPVAVKTPNSNNNKVMVNKSKIYRPFNKIKETKPEALLSRVIEIENQSTAQITKTDSTNNKSVDTDHVPVDNAVDNSDLVLIASVYRNPQSHMPSLAVEPVFDIHDKTAKESINALLKDDLGPRVNSSDNKINQREHSAKENQHIKLESTQDNNMSSTKPLIEKPEDRIKTSLNKGDIVNLKLDLQIQNNDNIEYKTDSKDEIQSITTSSPIEKVSQTVIERPCNMQNKSLISLIARELTNFHRDDKNRVIIVQCCRNCHIDAEESPKDYKIILPKEQCGKIKDNCDCKKLDTSKDIYEKRFSSVNPPMPTKSCVSIERLTTIRASCCVETKQPSHASEAASENEESGRKSVAINDPQTSKVFTMTEPVLVRKVEMRTAAVIEHSTQTEWCEILLQVSVLEDGHYSFYFPTIETLKKFNL